MSPGGDGKSRERKTASDKVSVGLQTGCQTCSAMKTVLALMAKVITAMRGHITRSEWRISFCRNTQQYITYLCKYTHTYIHTHAHYNTPEWGML